MAAEVETLARTQRHALSEMLYEAKAMHARLGGEAVGAVTRVHLDAMAEEGCVFRPVKVVWARAENRQSFRMVVWNRL